MSSSARVLHVLESIASADTPPTKSRLAASLGLARSTLNDIVTDLCALGYVRMVDTTVLAGPRFGRLTTQLIARPTLRSRLRPVLTRLSELSGESTQAYVAVPREDGALPTIFAIDVVESRQPVRYVSSPGPRTSLWPSPAGKVFLAHGHIPGSALPEEWIASEALEAAEVDCELETVREQGYAVCEYVQGMSAIAAPVLDSAGDMVAAVAIAGPSARMAPPAQRFWPLLSETLAELAPPR